MGRRISLAILCVLSGCLIVAVQPAHCQNPLHGYASLCSPDSAFVIYYPERLAPMAREIERILEDSGREMAGELGLERIGRITVYLTPDDEAYRYLNEGTIPEWGAAFSDLNSQVLGMNTTLVLRAPRPLKVVVRHELSHLLLAQRVGGIHMPTWFMEGLAIRQAQEWDFSESWRLMSLVVRKKLPYLQDLDGAFPPSVDEAMLAYGLSYVAVEELFRQRPDALLTLTAFVRDKGNFDAAFWATFGQSPSEFAGTLYVMIYKKYKLPGTIINVAPYWLLFALLFVAVYIVKRVRSRRKLNEWERREAGPPTPFGY